MSFKAIDSDSTRYATFSSTRNVVFVGDDVEVAGLAVKNDIISPIPVKPASYAVTDASVGENGEVNGCYVPANTGVLLKSKSDTASYYYVKSAYEVNLSGNMLKPAPVGGANSSPRQVTSIISWPIIITPPSKAWASIGEPRRVAPLR